MREQNLAPDERRLISGDPVKHPRPNAPAGFDQTQKSPGKAGSSSLERRKKSSADDRQIRHRPFDQELAVSWQPGIRVKEEQNVSPGTSGGLVVGGRATGRTTRVLRQEMDWWTEASNDCRRRVSTAAVDHDDLARRGLGEQRRHFLADHALLVKRWNDHRDHTDVLAG